MRSSTHLNCLWHTAVRLLYSEYDQVAVLLRLQLLQSLALVVVAGEGDIEPGVVGIVFVVCPI